MLSTRYSPKRISSLARWHCIALCCLMLICFGSGSVIASAASAPIVLYDGALGTLPDSQGFTFLAFPSVSPTASGGATVLDTSGDKSTYAGYFSRPTPQLVLDRTIGYTISFTVQVELEDHAGSDRNNDQ